MAQHYKNDKISLERVQLFCGWLNLNTAGCVAPGRMSQNLCGQLWSNKSTEAVQLSVYSTEDRISFTEAMKQTYKPTKVGTTFGPSWTTHWFRLKIAVPSSMADKEVHLLWNSNSEALVWTEDGAPRQGLVGGNGMCRRIDYTLFKSAPADGANLVLYIEMACNGLFGVGRGGDIEPPDPDMTFLLQECCIGEFNQAAWDLLHDLTVIHRIASTLPKGNHRREQATLAGNAIVNACVVNDPSTYANGRKIAKEFFSAKNGDAQVKLISVGHCHIDTAWLWPYAETKRKCARSWSTQIRNMEQYPDYKFVCSQAQQFVWVKENYPALWTEIKQRVVAGQFIPVGGTWVEMDCNIPSGESLVRQFLFGQNFFVEEFKIQCREFWLPDTFGYSAQLPQIMRGVGITRFLTQKLSWNLFNKFPHSTFIWEGIDGSQVISHFPPAETYNAIGSIEEVMKSVTNNKDIGICPVSLLLYGHGDGGGGPSPAMIESLSRLDDIDGIPNITFTDVNTFFEEAEKRKDSLPRWVGELYFELHRGTYTSQAKTKKGNRFCEIALREVEILAAFALALNSTFRYPSETIREMWKLVLLNQFHDTLPGSAIGAVFKDAEEHYQLVLDGCKNLKEKLLDALYGAKPKPPKRPRVMDEEGGEDKRNFTKEGGTKTICIMDLNGFARRKTVIQLANEEESKFFPLGQKAHTGGTLIAIDDKTNGVGLKFPSRLLTDRDTDCVRLIPNGDLIMENGKLRAVLTAHGRLSSLILKGTRYREFIKSGGFGNKFVVYDDVPLFWDAWDVEVYNYEKTQFCVQAHKFEILENGPLRAAVKFHYSFGEDKSSIEQIVYLRAESARLDFETRVQWHESRKILRVEIETDIRSSFAHYESQFGYIQRNTHFNTSWDVAKFEVCGHRYADLSEHGFGIALLNNCKYGYSVRDNLMRLSLLRAPKSPDENCDMGLHSFTYAIFPHFGSFPNFEVVKEAADLNIPTTANVIDVNDIKIYKPLESVLSIEYKKGEPESIIIDTIKKAEDTDCAIVVRLYESMGGQRYVQLRGSSMLRVKRAMLSNLLEHQCREIAAEIDDATGDVLINLEFTPFQIKTIILEI